MTDTYAEHGPRLLKMGYEPVPILPGTKAPDVHGWPKLKLTEGVVSTWAGNGRADHGVGLRTGRLVALDLDIEDPDLVDEMVDYCREHIGPSPRRTGKAPRAMLMYQCDQPMTKRTSAAFEDWMGDHKLEVMGQGQQVVAFGIHPGTLQPYHWDEDLLPLDQLTKITPEQVQAAIAHFETLATAAKMDRRSAGTAAQQQDNPDWDENALFLANHKPPLGISQEEALDVLSHIDPEPHDAWVKVGMALKHEFGEAGRTIWEHWSNQAPNAGGFDRWGSFDPAPLDRDPVTMRTILYMAVQAGMPPRMQEQPPPTSPDEWPELVTLDTAPPPRLPIDDWPEPLRSYALAAAAETETPPELPAMLALGVVAAAAHKLTDVEIKPGYREPINIYTVVALPPATRKSAEFKRATKPLVQWEAKQREVFAEDLKRAESLLATHRERVKALRVKAAKAADDAEAKKLAEQVAELEANEPQLPKARRVFTSDVTTEHLATMMADNGEAMAVMSSEGGIFETMAGRYSGNVANIDLYLQAHAADPVRVDRGSKTPVLMDSPRITMTLAVQPDVLEALSNKPGFRGRGLLGRVLYVVPPSILGDRTGDTPQASAREESEYHKQIEALLDASRDDHDPGTLTLSTDARELWAQFWDTVEQQLGELGQFHHMTDWAGKLPGVVARIATLFHLSKHGPSGLYQSVGADSMAAAVSTGHALAGHATAVYGLMGADPDIEGAKVLVRWIRRHGRTEFTARDAHSDHRSKFTRAADLDGPLAVLVERGYLAEVPSEKGQLGRPRRSFAVNPAVHI